MAANTSKWPQVHNYWLKFDDLDVYPQVFGGKEHINTTLDITDLLNHYEIEFMTFSCPLSPNAQTSQEDISDLGKDLMVDLFGGKSNDTLSSLRHIIFTKKVATAEAFVTP